MNVAKFCRRYTDNKDKSLTVVESKYRSEWFKLKDVNQSARTERNVDEMYKIKPHFSRSEITERMKAEECEYCRVIRGFFEVHHVSKMADIKGGKEFWQKLMIARNRKKIVVCIECHDLLHASKLPDFRFKAMSA